MSDAMVNHPASLRVFFATEMWERYGFYVVQTLLALYLALHFRWHDKEIYTIVSSFTAITYLSPILGGWVADNLLGQKRTIIVGALFLFVSYLALSLIHKDWQMLASLAGIAVGTGFLKPNISSLLGNQYPMDSPKRDSGFTIFYMGITTGIILGTILPSQLNWLFGWPVAFASAALGMIVSLTVFIIGVKKYHIEDYHVIVHTKSNAWKACALVVGLWIISFVILYQPLFANLSFGLVCLLAIFYLISTASREPKEQARQTIVIGLLCVISVLFWAFYFQMFMSLTLLISRIAQPTLFGILFPAPYYVSVQSAGMLLFGYFISRAKPKAHEMQSGIRTGNKFLLSMCLMVLAYALIVYTCYRSLSLTLASPLLLIPAYLMISLAELLLSPVGLAAITTLASRRKVSTMMGIFFVSLGIGGFLSGKLAYITAVHHRIMTLGNLKMHYLHTFTALLIILLLATLVCGILNLFIKKLLKSNGHWIASSLRSSQ